MMDGERSAPSLRDQMPGFARWMDAMRKAIGKETVDAMVKASGALRAAVDADDYEQVNAIYRLRHGTVHWVENGIEFGVGEDEMRAFAERHRALRRHEQG